MNPFSAARVQAFPCCSCRGLQEASCWLRNENPGISGDESQEPPVGAYYPEGLPDAWGPGFPGDGGR